MSSNRVVPITGIVFLVLSISAARFTPARSHVAAARSELDPCKLLSADEASTALGGTIKSAEREGGDLIPGCMWSRAVRGSFTDLQLSLAIHSIVSYNAAMHPRIPTISTEPISGVGDDAFYALYSNGDPPFLWAKKGDKSISLRILMPTNKGPFTADQLKSKLLVLGKAVIARM